MDDNEELEMPVLHQYLKYYEGIIYDEDIIPCPEDSQMRSDWSTLPLLALKNVLIYLNREDALACLSTCRHWRNALLLYEAEKTTVKLRVNDMERSLFVSNIFRKRVKKLIIYANTCNEEHIEKFFKDIISMYIDTPLEELFFIGNSYLHLNPIANVPELPRASFEALVLTMRSLKRLSLLGCKLGTAKDMKLEIKDKEALRRAARGRIRQYGYDPFPYDSVISRCNCDLVTVHNIHTIVLDYDLINTESLETLSDLRSFRYLTMMIRDKPNFSLPPIDWIRLQPCFPTPLKITVCLLQLPISKIDDLMDNVLIQGLNLVSLKALFCKTMYSEVMVQVANMYNKTLQEFVWADCPFDPNSQRSLKKVRLPELNMCNMNPLILLCWQCERLMRVVIHGYWVQQYDVLGMLRLRRALRHLELSSVCAPHGQQGEGITRVLRTDPPQFCDENFIEQVSCFHGMTEWTPVPWSRLHPGLQAEATRRDRADYVMLETHTPFGVT